MSVSTKPRLDKVSTHAGRWVDVEHGATKGAMVGRDLYDADGTLITDLAGYFRGAAIAKDTMAVNGVPVERIITRNGTLIVKEIATEAIKAGDLGAVVNINGGGITATSGGKSLELGAGFGTGGDLVFYFGPTPSDMAHADKASATIWMDAAGNAYFGGALLRDGDIDDALTTSNDALTTATNAQAAADGANLLASQTIKPSLLYPFAGAAAPSGIAISGGALVSAEGGTASALDASTTDPVITISGVNLPPGSCYAVAARVKVTAGAWQGTCYYTTSGHGNSESFKKQLAAPATGTWVTLVWDMRDLTNGGADFVSAASILSLRLDLGASADSVVEIDWIAVGQFGTVSQADVDNALAAANSAQYTANGKVGGAGANLIPNPTYTLNNLGVATNTNLFSGDVCDGWAIDVMSAGGLAILNYAGTGPGIMVQIANPSMANGTNAYASVATKEKIPVEAGENYLIKWTNAVGYNGTPNAGFSIRYRVVIDWKDGSDTNLSYTIFDVLRGAANPGEGCITAPAGAASCKIQTYAMVTNSSGATNTPLAAGGTLAMRVTWQAISLVKQLSNTGHLPMLMWGNQRAKVPTSISYSATAGISIATATISVAAFTITSGTRSIAYNAMSVGVSGAKGSAATYYLYVDDPTAAGGAQTLVAATSDTTVYQGNGRLYIGIVTVNFPSSGSGSGSGTRPPEMQ